MIQAGLLAALLLAAGTAAPAYAEAAAPTVADQAGSGGAQTQPLPQAPTPAPGPQHTGPQHNGVIRPPQADIDPHMTVTPPHRSGGTMPVIPPPGSPGGKPDVEPR